MPDQLTDLMREAGLSEVRFTSYMFGTMAIHVGRLALNEKAKMLRQSNRSIYT